jgi:hypothetical protein
MQFAAFPVIAIVMSGPSGCTNVRENEPVSIVVLMISGKPVPPAGMSVEVQGIEYLAAGVTLANFKRVHGVLRR